ncbi:MAG: hypothetical protein HN553_02290 [Opitutae bacterium]|nr:hypothetical protein [Opitutae bacterium]
MDTPPEENNSDSSSASDADASEEAFAADKNLDPVEDAQTIEISHAPSDSDSVTVPADDDSRSSLGGDIDSGSMHAETENINSPESDNSAISEVNSDVLNGNGDVAQFRQTLASLSEQLEIDRLAFLHKKVEDHGVNVPTLNEIASDISGEKMINSVGDSDVYSQRPKARMEGWISGLSFGISKRAKKFSK